MIVTERFTNRVEDYVKFRPSYPPEIIELMRREMNLSENSAVAEVGSGTGILTKMLLATGARVFGVEPNAAMRAAGENFLRNFGFDKFTSLDGAAENTSLMPQSIDLIVAAQAFHWFDRERTRREFERVLRPSGFVALVWNVREVDADDFSVDYENLLRQFGTDYAQVAERHSSQHYLLEFFGGEFAEKSFDYSQTFDLEGLTGRLNSSSYAPTPDAENYPAMMSALEQLFTRHARENKVKFNYQTKVYYGKLK